MSINERNPVWTTLPGTSSYPITNAATQNTSRNKRITDEGYQLVDELYKLDPYPSQSQKKEIFKRILALPGCEHYKYENLNQRLASFRKRDGVTGSKPGMHIGKPSLTKNIHAVANPSSTEEILYPSLIQRPGIIAALQILLKDSPTPTPTEVRIWATRLGVFKDDVHTWIAFQQDGLLKEPPNPISSQLPTPGSSCSPEPASPATPAALPQAVAQRLAPVYTKTEPGTSPGCQSPSSILSWNQLQDLAESVHVARTGSGTPPVSPEDAIQVLDQHAERMQAFLQRYERGDYVGLGLAPQMLQAENVSVKHEPLTPT